MLHKQKQGMSDEHDLTVKFKEMLEASGPGRLVLEHVRAVDSVLLNQGRPMNAWQECAEFRRNFCYAYQRDDRCLGLPRPLPRLVCLLNLSGRRACIYSNNVELLRRLALTAPDASERVANGIEQVIKKAKDTEASLLFMLSTPWQAGLERLYWEVRTVQRKATASGSYQLPSINDGAMMFSSAGGALPKIAARTLEADNADPDVRAAQQVEFRKMFCATTIDLDLDAVRKEEAKGDVAHDAEARVQKLQQMLGVVSADRKKILSDMQAQKSDYETKICEHKGVHDRKMAALILEKQAAQEQLSIAHAEYETKLKLANQQKHNIEMAAKTASAEQISDAVLYQEHTNKRIGELEKEIVKLQGETKRAWQGKSSVEKEVKRLEAREAEWAEEKRRLEAAHSKELSAALDTQNHIERAKQDAVAAKVARERELEEDRQLLGRVQANWDRECEAKQAYVQQAETYGKKVEELKHRIWKMAVHQGVLVSDVTKARGDHMRERDQRLISEAQIKLEKADQREMQTQSEPELMSKEVQTCGALPEQIEIGKLKSEIATLNEKLATRAETPDSTGKVTPTANGSADGETAVVAAEPASPAKHPAKVEYSEFPREQPADPATEALIEQYWNIGRALADMARQSAMYRHAADENWAKYNALHSQAQAMLGQQPPAYYQDQNYYNQPNGMQNMHMNWQQGQQTYHRKGGRRQ